MRNLNIFIKLFLSHTTVGLFVVMVLSFSFYLLLRNSLIQRTIDQLSSINILKKDLIVSHLSRSKQDLEAMHLENRFLHLYTTLSGKRQEDAGVADYPETIKYLLDLYENVIVLDSLPRVVLNTATSPVITDGLLQNVDSIMRSGEAHFQIIDASRYSRDSTTLLFYYVPVLQNSHTLGAVLIQDDFQKIQSALFETTGMGSTGESYIVGRDYRMRSMSRFLAGRPFEIVARTEAVTVAFDKPPRFDHHLIEDYRGVKVVSAYRKIEESGLDWVILSEIDFDEAMQPVVQMRNSLAGITVAIMLVIVFVTLLLSNAIARPILRLREIILMLSKGIVPEEKPVKPSRDELGQIAEAIHQLIEGLKRTTVFAREIGSGNFSASFTTLSDKDSLGMALLRMQDELKRFNEREKRLVRERAAALLEGQENERRRITQELHDGVGQLLTAISMQIEMIDGENKLKDDIKKQINETIAEVKRISYNVMPNAIVDYGLEAALKGLFDNVRKYSAIQVDFRYIKETKRKLDFEVSIAVFRIVQEGLNNVVKHSKAATVDLHLLDKDDELYFMLADNGAGFDVDEALRGGGSGLRNMRERTELLNGTATIYSTPGVGTVVEVSIPLKIN